MSAGTRGWQKLLFYHHHFIPTTCNCPGMWIILWQYGAHFTYALCSDLPPVKQDIFAYEFWYQYWRWGKKSFLHKNLMWTISGSMLKCAEGWGSVCQTPAVILPGDRQQEEWMLRHIQQSAAHGTRGSSAITRWLVALAMKGENELVNLFCPRLLDFFPFLTLNDLKGLIERGDRR